MINRVVAVGRLTKDPLLRKQCQESALVHLH